MISDHKSFAAAQAYVDPAEDIVRRFLPMVRKLAWHLHGSAPPDMDPEDLMQAGLVALTECAQRHSGPDADGFAAYAKIRVKGAMIDQLRRSAPLSRGAIQRRRELREAQERLQGRLGRAPSLTEVAEEMGMELAELENMRSTSEPLRFESMDESYSDADPAFGDQSPNALALMLTEENRDALASAIAALPERLQIVIQLYFVDELNLAEIAAVLGVSVPRIHQIKDQALCKLRDELSAGGIDEIA